MIRTTNSPLEGHIGRLVEWASAGKNFTEIARILTDEGTPTTRDSIRRAFRRHRLTKPKAYYQASAPPSVVNTLPWGDGAAKLVKPATTEETETVVFGSDFHFPYQDTACIESFIELCDHVGPHRIVLNGDLNDFFQLSRFNKALERMDELQEEIDQANAFRKRIRELFPDAVIDETQGNHDYRILSFVLNNAKALHSLRALNPSYLFGYNDLDINWHPGCGYLLRPNFLVKHGTLVRKFAGYTAKAELEAAGISGLSGHCHRLATYRLNNYNRNQWTEGGCLCRIDPDYVTGPPNWQTGCVVGEFSTRSDQFVIHEVPFTTCGKFQLFQ